MKGRISVVRSTRDRRCPPMTMQASIETPPDVVQPKPEGARQLSISLRQFDRLIADGELPVVELSPRRVGVLQSDIDAYKQARRVIRGKAA
jgi:predicted DNA-binding transcriptional regulator AlpA